MSDREDVRKLVTGCLDCSVLYTFADLLAEKLLLGFSEWEVRVMACVALDADTPTLLGHSKHKGPSFFWIQICIRQHQQALVLPKLDVGLQVLEQRPRMILLDLRVLPDAGLNDPVILQNAEARF